MQNTGRRDTAPEVALRRELHRRGLRYRVDAQVAGVPRVRPDIVFTNSKVVVMVDGCFWHSCPTHATTPKSNREWWIQKLSANEARDRRTDLALAEAGWEVVRVWEHEDPIEAAVRVEEAVGRRRHLLDG